MKTLPSSFLFFRRSDRLKNPLFLHRLTWLCMKETTSRCFCRGHAIAFFSFELAVFIGVELHALSFGEDERVSRELNFFVREAFNIKRESAELGVAHVERLFSQILQFPILDVISIV